MSYTPQQLADLYERAVSAEAAGICSTDAGYALDDMILRLGTNTGEVIRKLIDQLRAAGRNSADPVRQHPGLNVYSLTVPADLHDATQRLVISAAEALALKLLKAQAKRPDYPTGWRADDWEADCRAGLLNHIQKGDPLDVMAYAAFMHYHGWSTAKPEPEITPELTAQTVASLEDDNDPITVPRGLLGAALGAISHPQHAASATVGALKHYAYSQPKQTGTVKPEIWSDYYSRTMCKKPKLITGPLEHAYKELTPQIMRNLLDCFERYGTLPGDMVAIQALRIALDGIERRTQQPPINTGLSWQDYKGISDRDPVHEALQGFTEDATEDNAICIVRAIAEALRPRPRFWIDMHGFSSKLFTSEADAVESCNKTGGLYVLPLFAGEPINCKLPMSLCRPADEPETIIVSHLLANLRSIPQRYTSDYVSLADIYTIIEALRGSK